jgi:hypothetical protein
VCDIRLTAKESLAEGSISDGEVEYEVGRAYDAVARSDSH